MNIPFKKDPEEYRQGMLFPGNLFDLLPQDHCCFVYEDIFQQIDTSSLMKNYSRRGQNAFDPRLITSILIYAYSQGIFSSRQIKQRCKEDLGFMYISHRQCPDFRVLSDFRKDNYEFFKECFKQSVLLSMEAGLASLGHVSLDGSKFKANTSKHKAMSYKRLKEQEKQLTDEIETLIQQAEQCDDEEDQAYKERTGYEIPEDLKYKEERLKKIAAAKKALEKREQELNPDKAIEDKKQISFTDHDARIMGKNGQFDYNYNSQISVDEDNQIIVGQHVSQNANDKKEVSPALDQIKENTGELPDKMSLDNGFFSGDNLETLEESSVDAYVACGKDPDISDIEQNDRKIKKTDFTYNENTDSFICPQGHSLTLKSNGKSGTKIYQASIDVCSVCPYQKRCCQSKKGEARIIAFDRHEPLRKAMYEKMQQKSSREIYNKRKHIVEPVFGQIKNTGFRQFSVRGSPKVSGEFSLVCITHNLSKIVKAIFRGTVRLESGRLAPVLA
jgi:transposase